jgi:quercetin dioxygenase-like cupin family protein
MKKPRRQRRGLAGTLGGDAGVTAVVKLRAKLEAEGYEVTLQLLAPGTLLGEHCSCEARLEAVFSGRLRLVIGHLERRLGPGDWLEVPRGATLVTEVLGDEPVLCLLAVRNCPAD